VVDPGELRFDSVKWLSVLVTVLMIGFMMSGPQPRRMTKWGAFWAYLIPYSIGIFYVLLRDSPFNQRMNLLDEPRPKDRIVVDPLTNETIPRHGGGAMFLFSAVSDGLAISLVLLGLAQVFATYLDPVSWSSGRGRQSDDAIVRGPVLGVIGTCGDCAQWEYFDEFKNHPAEPDATRRVGVMSEVLRFPGPW